MWFAVVHGGVDGLCDPLGALLGALGPVRDLDPAGDPGLKDDLLRFARHRSREDAMFAAWVLTAVRNQVGVEDGYVDSIGWLAWKTGISRSELRRVVRLAELFELLPDTGAAWRSGQVSTAAVEMIAGARVPGFDEQLVAIEGEFLERAKRGDYKTLGMLTQHFRKCARADGSKPEHPDGCSVAQVGDRIVMRADCTTTSGQTVREALEKFTRVPAANDESTLAQRQGEAHVRICEIALNRGTDAEGARPVVSYLTQARDESDTTHPMTLGLLSGVVDPRERERILCDSVIVPVTTNKWGEILNIGRATPVWNRAQRRAITSRSPHCQWPGCETIAAWCDIHHHQSWEHGGETSLANGVHLCRRHHVFPHQHRDWHYTFDHQHFRVYRADGTTPTPGTASRPDAARVPDAKGRRRRDVRAVPCRVVTAGEQRALDDLIELLDLEPLEANLFRGRSPEEWRQRVFGGQVAGQALVASGRTVDPARVIHSCHAYFLRPGDPSVPIVYEVDRIRDGRSFTTRRVVAIQHGRAIFNLQASYQIDEAGPEHQDPMPAVASPESLPTMPERFAPYQDKFGPEFADWVQRERPIDSRPTEVPAWLDHNPRPPAQDVWIKANGVLPDDPLLHVCIVAYASDLTILDTAMLPHGSAFSDGEFQVASLDHAMWFHRPFRADEWLLYHQRSQSASHARGIAEGSIFTRDGRLVVTVMQEGLMRPNVAG